MKIKLEIPAELREAIENYLAALNSALERSPENRAAITDEIAKLESDARGLQGEVAGLQHEVVANDSAAVTLNAKQGRLQLVNSRLDELRTTLINLKPVSLFGAEQILVKLTALYSVGLPGQIVCALTEICPNYDKALMMAKLSDAYMCLRGIRAWSYGINALEATPANVQKLKSILNRALRSQAHLGADMPQPDIVLAAVTAPDVEQSEVV